MKTIYTLTDVNSGERLYFSSYEKRTEYCKNIMLAALEAGILPPEELPTFGLDYDSSYDYVLEDGPIDLDY